MHYLNEPNFSHAAPQTLGVLLVNMGTPDTYKVADVRRYLREFLSDPRLVEMPRFLWWLILHGIILRIRPYRSARAYQRIWHNATQSPLLAISWRQVNALQGALEQRGMGAIHTALAMRYGNPAIIAGLEKLRKIGAHRILILPLYPQYSATTTASVFDQVTTVLQSWRFIPELRFIHWYHDHPAYITALIHSISKYWQEHGEPERLLFSFHGIPKAYFLAGDPYYCHCQKTARLVTEKLMLNSERWTVAFQSRIGPQEWLTPYTDQQLQTWAKAGIGKVHVICPGFAADCLETLDEIAIENREHFLAAGGKECGYIPALNDDIEHVNALAEIIMQNLHGWI